MNYKKLTNGFVRSRVKDASQKSLDLFLGNESSAEEYDRCKEMAQIIDDWIEEGRQGVTYKEVVDYLTQEGFVHYKDASPKREYWTTKNRLTTAGLLIMHTNKGNGELENEIVYICDLVSNIPALPKALLGDSRRVKDESNDLLNRDIVILKQFYVGKANYSTDEFKDGQVCSLDEFLRKCAGIQHNVKTCDHSDCVVEQDGKYRMDFLDKKNTPEISIWFNFVDMENARLFIVSYMNKSFY